MKLKDMGTTGLVEWAITGPFRLYGARVARAKKIILARHSGLGLNRWKAADAFQRACNLAYEKRRR